MNPDLLDARLKRVEAEAYRRGNKWLVELCRKKRHEARDKAHEKPVFIAKKRSSI